MGTEEWIMRLALTSQEPIGHADVGAQELHGQQAKLVEGARRSVFPNAEGEPCLLEAELLGFEGATCWEGGVDKRKVHTGTAWPLAFTLTQGCGQQEDLDVGSKQGKAAICRERKVRPSGVSATPVRLCGTERVEGRNTRAGVKPSLHHVLQGSAGLSDLASTSYLPPTD